MNVFVYFVNYRKEGWLMKKILSTAVCMVCFLLLGLVADIHSARASLLPNPGKSVMVWPPVSFVNGNWIEATTGEDGRF